MESQIYTEMSRALEMSAEWNEPIGRNKRDC
jgi:hypothetical protein